MIVEERPLAAFDEFISANGLAWKRALDERSKERRGFVLVDLLHNNASVLVLNILVARYLAELLGAGVMGVTSSTFTCFPVPVSEVSRLARSFGVDKVAVIGAGEEDHRPTFFGLPLWLSRLRAQKTVDELQSLSGEELRRAVLALQVDGVDVGDLVYDSFLYALGIGTFEDYDERLGHEYRRAIEFSRGVNHIFRSNSIRAVVVSHTVYVDYGVLMRVALKHGIPVFGKAGLDPFRVRKYTKADESKKFVAFLEPSQVPEVRALFGESFDREADLFYPPRPSSLERPDFFRYGYGEQKEQVPEKQLLRDLGLDETLPTCVIMAHRFIDAVHFSGEALFDDYYQWLDVVLDLTCRVPGVNWLLKQHPYEVLMGENEYFDRLVAKYGQRNQNLKVVPDRIATSSLFSCVTAMTTVNGTAGLEFATAGIPCVLAGYPFYAEFEFVERSRSRQEYLDRLASFDRLRPLPQRLIDQAKAAALVQFKYTWVSSSLVPRISDLAGGAATGEDFERYWQDLTRRMSALSISDDPLFKNLSRMISHDGRLILNCELSPDIESEASGADRTGRGGIDEGLAGVQHPHAVFE